MNVPPFKPGRGKTPTTNYDTLLGAQKLAAMIRAAWAEAGHDVPVEIVPIQPGNPLSSYTVRMPTLINGLPARVGP